MEYKVVPFVAVINQSKGSLDQVAQQLEELIQSYSSEGWEYLRLESVTTFVQPDSGCFGIGGKSAYETSKQMIIFSK